MTKMMNMMRVTNSLEIYLRNKRERKRSKIPQQHRNLFKRLSNFIKKKAIKMISSFNKKEAKQAGLLTMKEVRLAHSQITVIT